MTFRAPFHRPSSMLDKTLNKLCFFLELLFIGSSSEAQLLFFPRAADEKRRITS